MTTLNPFLCLGCAHNHGDSTCNAFPDGIPAEILGGFDHRNPWPGDHGITFQPEKGMERVEETYDAYRLAFP